MNGYKVRTEIIAGLSTFVTMAYILILNPTILSEAGMDFGSVMVATILSSFFATCLLGLIANYPLVIAPGMGVTVFFTYTIVIERLYTWQEGLAAVLIVAIIIFFISLFKLREKILQSIPHALLKGMTAGIGLFLAFVAMRELGVFLYDSQGFDGFANPLTLEAFFTLITVILVSILLRWKFSSAFLVGIIFIWICGLFSGLTEWKGIFALPPSLHPTFLAVDFGMIYSLKFLGITFTLLLLSLFDSSAALLSLSQQLNYFTEDKQLFRARRVLIPDGLGSICASLLGTCNLSFLLEGASGIKAGGRTGISAIVIAICLLTGLFLYPFISSIPHFASAPILLVIGYFMTLQIRELKWNCATDVIPGLITMISMPLTFSIYKGFAYGFISYAFVKIISGKMQETNLVVIILSLIFLFQLIFLAI